MKQNYENINIMSIAPLTNVSRCMNALDRIINRPGHLPGIIALYGYSGYGKSTAASFVANKHEACYVEAKDTWTKKTFLEAVASELEIKNLKKTIAHMAQQIAEELSASQRPLIIDEFDYLVRKNAVDMVRDLYDSSNSPILIIGEESLESNLSRWERFHNRVLDWIPAEPCGQKDTQLLRNLYCQHVTVSDDLLQKVIETCKGNASRTCINLANIQEFALQNGMSDICLKDWANKPLFDGKAPRRRAR